MSSKVKTIVLAYGVPHPQKNGVFNYLVEKVTDSTDFAPRQILEKPEVDALCAARDWKVTIIAIKD